MPRTPRQRRREKTRQEILSAAHQMIAQQGFDQLTMRQLAEKIDYSPAGLYEYFDSKEQIVAELCLEGHQRLGDTIRRVSPDLPPDEYLVDIGLAYIDFALHNPEHYRLMFTTEPPEGQLQVMVGEVSSFPVLVDAIQRGIEAGVFQPRPGFDVEAMAYAAWSLVHGISMLRITHLKQYEADFDTADRKAVEALARGLGSEGER